MRVTKALLTPSKPRAPHSQGQHSQVILEAGVTTRKSTSFMLPSPSPSHYFPLGLGLFAMLPVLTRAPAPLLDRLGGIRTLPWRLTVADRL